MWTEFPGHKDGLHILGQAGAKIGAVGWGWEEVNDLVLLAMATALVQAEWEPELAVAMLVVHMEVEWVEWVEWAEWAECTAWGWA